MMDMISLYEKMPGKVGAVNPCEGYGQEKSP